nr:MATE family efflux transporter [Barnesiella viscericola]
MRPLIYLQSRRTQLKRVIALSIPAILAEISSMVMQYIDAAMVGSLGANASASIGLVSTSTWLMGGLCISTATGYSVQAAHLIGAGRYCSAFSAPP